MRAVQYNFMSAASTPVILALDFDGVVCDGLKEYFLVAWRTYCQVWSVNQTPDPDLAAKFYRLRPVIETGWEMPVLIKALVDGVESATILSDWEAINQGIIQQYHLDSTNLSSTLDKLRDEWITQDLEEWLSLHEFYPDVAEKIKRVLKSAVKLYIITTKEKRFVQQLLQKQGVELPQSFIFGKESKRPKYEILQELIQKANISPESLWFVEDRLKTLQLVQKQAHLAGVRLYLADWGYNTPAEREIVKNDARIHLLSLSQMDSDFSNWG